MASVHKANRKDSQYWQASFYGVDGKRKLISTKQTNRKKALAIAQQWEAAATKAKTRELTEVQARKVLQEILTLSSGERLSSYALREWFEEWYKLVANEGVAASTLERYKQVTRDFVLFMGDRADAPLQGVSVKDINAYRGKLIRDGLKSTSVNIQVKKIIQQPFKRAHDSGYIDTNPVATLKVTRDSAEKRDREPFSIQEVSALLRAAKDQPDWTGAILLAVSTGLRLGNIANITWGNVDLDTGFLNLRTNKRVKAVLIPLHPDFRSWLMQRPRGIGKAPIFPKLSGGTSGGRSGLSSQFAKLMVVANVAGEITGGEGKGRATSTKSFHSFRHTMISNLANGGVSEEVRSRIIGHVDRKTHQIYTHLDLGVLTDAVSRLPKFSE